MSYWAVALFGVAMVFGLLGFYEPFDTARTMARILFALFLAFALLVYFLNRRLPRSR